MAFYRIGQAAEVLGVSADTVRRWVDAERLVAERDEAGHRWIAGESLAAFAVELAEKSDSELPYSGSARNRFSGIITRVVKDKVSAQVEVQAGPHRVVSLITAEAVDELGLAPGMLAVATVKATSVMIDPLTLPDGDEDT